MLTEFAAFTGMCIEVFYEGSSHTRRSCAIIQYCTYSTVCIMCMEDGSKIYAVNEDPSASLLGPHGNARRNARGELIIGVMNHLQLRAVSTFL